MDIRHLIYVSVFYLDYIIDGLVQERRNSSALAIELRFIVLTHRYKHKTAQHIYTVWIYYGASSCLYAILSPMPYIYGFFIDTKSMKYSSRYVCIVKQI